MFRKLCEKLPWGLLAGLLIGVLSLCIVMNFIQAAAAEDVSVKILTEVETLKIENQTLKGQVLDLQLRIVQLQYPQLRAAADETTKSLEELKLSIVKAHNLDPAAWKIEGKEFAPVPNSK